MQRVYTSYAPLVHTVCRHGFGGFRGFFDPIDREDAVQSIFAAAFTEKARLSYNGIDPYASFLRGIAHNVVRRMLESRKRFERKPEQLVQESEDLEAAAIHRQALDAVRQFRESVTDPTEATILARYFCDGWAEEKLAEHLGITRYKTRKLIAKLQKRMRKHLKAHGIATP